jgi:hypothetical protein
MQNFTNAFSMDAVICLHPDHYQTTLKSTGDGRYAHASVITGKFKC